MRFLCSTSSLKIVTADNYLPGNCVGYCISINSDLLTIACIQYNLFLIKIIAERNT